MAGWPLQGLDKRNDQPALGNHGHHHPFQQVALDGFDLYFQFGLDGQDVAFDGQDVGLDSQDVGLGGQVAVEQLDLLICKGLSLFLRKAAGRQVLDKPVSIKGNRFAHEVIIGDEVSACKTLYERRWSRCATPTRPASPSTNKQTFTGMTGFAP